MSYVPWAPERDLHHDGITLELSLLLLSTLTHFARMVRRSAGFISKKPHHKSRAGCSVCKRKKVKVNNPFLTKQSVERWHVSVIMRRQESKNIVVKYQNQGRDVKQRSNG